MSRKSSSTRIRILESCQNLLETQGAADVRMTDIARRAGITRQALYLHFPNRAELLVATTRHVDEANGIHAIMGVNVVERNGVARLEGFIDTWGNYIPKIYGVAKALMAIRDTDAEAHAALDDRMLALRALCDLTVRSLKDNGKLAAELEIVEAVDILWTLISIRNWEQLTQDCGWSQEKYLTFLQRSSQMLIATSGETQQTNPGKAAP